VLVISRTRNDWYTAPQGSLDLPFWLADADTLLTGPPCTTLGKYQALGRGEDANNPTVCYCCTTVLLPWFQK